MSESSPAYQQLRHAVRDSGVGGVVWFASNVYETAHLTRRLQQEARVPLLISADLEAGLRMRFLDTTFWPPALAVGATGDPSPAGAEGRGGGRGGEGARGHHNPAARGGGHRGT